MPSKLHDPNRQTSEYQGWFDLRAAIFRQAIEDFEECSLQSRRFVTEYYCKLPERERIKQKGIGYVLNLRWVKAAEVFDWFHSKDADYYLVDTDFTGADLWRLYITGEWNRGGIKDKPYKPPKLPNYKEYRRPLPDKYGYDTEMSFTDYIYKSIAAEKAKEQRRKELIENHVKTHETLRKK